MPQHNAVQANSAQTGKIYRYRVVDFQKGLDILVLCDELEDAIKAKREYEAERQESEIFITIYDDRLGRYIMTRIDK